MIEAPHYSAAGASKKAVPLPEALFDGTVNEDLLHRAVITFLSNQRQGTSNTLTRSRGARKAPAAPGRVPPAPRTGGTAASRMGRIRAATGSGFPRRCASWPRSRRSTRARAKACS